MPSTAGDRAAGGATTPAATICGTSSAGAVRARFAGAIRASSIRRAAAAVFASTSVPNRVSPSASPTAVIDSTNAASAAVPSAARHAVDVQSGSSDGVSVTTRRVSSSATSRRASNARAIAGSIACDGGSGSTRMRGRASCGASADAGPAAATAAAAAATSDAMASERFMRRGWIAPRAAAMANEGNRAPQRRCRRVSNA
jgi:hypothetical protein